LTVNRWEYRRAAGGGSCGRDMLGVAGLALCLLASQFVVYLALVTGASVFAMLTSGSAVTAEEALSAVRDDEVAHNVILLLTTVVSMTVPCSVYMKLKRRRTAESVNFGPPMPKRVVFWIVAALASMYAVMYVFAFIVAALELTPYSFGFPDGIAFPVTAAGRVMFFFSIVAAPAIFEELAFRGVILGELKKYGPGFAIAASSILFGFIHGSFPAFFFATTIGMFSAYVALTTGSLRFPVLLHAVNNSIAYALMWCGQSYGEHNAMLINAIFQMAVSAAGVLAVIALSRRGEFFDMERLGLPETDKGVVWKKFFNPLTVTFLLLTVALAAVTVEVSLK